MSETPSGMYNEHGQVENEDLAHEMANIEKPYHEKTLGIIPATKGKISKGEQKAEEYVTTGINVKNKDQAEVPKIDHGTWTDIAEKIKDYISANLPDIAKWTDYNFGKGFVGFDKAKKVGLADGTAKFVLEGSFFYQDKHVPNRRHYIATRVGVAQGEDNVELVDVQIAYPFDPVFEQENHWETIFSTGKE